MTTTTTLQPLFTMSTNHSMIDVHAHVYPDIYHQALLGEGKTDSMTGHVVVDGYPAPPWSEQATLQFMDENDVAASVLSITTPGVAFLHHDQSAARRLARRLNEEFAAMIRRHPHRFGAFAVLPLPDVDAALDEIRYALDVLGLDGVGLYSNVNGIYLGDPRFERVFEELDRRLATVFVHPSQPAVSAMNQIGLGIAGPVLEYPFDTTRVATNLVLSGTLDRYPNVKIILSHGGGTLPFLGTRIDSLLSFMNSSSVEEGEILRKLRSLYFDLALVSNHEGLAALKEFMPPSQLLIGFDFPYAPASKAVAARQAFNAFEGFSDPDREAIRSGNASRLFPHLATRRRMQQ